MKHLREFDDQEIQDLMGDLEKVGHERLKGWYIGTINEDGYFGICAVLAHNEAELEQIMREHDQAMQAYGIQREINKANFNNLIFQSQILNAIKH